jgi:hypothetical protein
MVRSPARLTSAGSTAYNQETLVIPLSSKNQPCRRTDGDGHALPKPSSAAASSLSRSNKITTEPTTQLANGHPALARADPPPTRSVLHLNAAAAT